MSFCALVNGLGTLATAMLTQAPDTCNILRVNQTVDPYGRSQGSFAAINGSPVPCTYESLSGVERDTEGAEIGIASYRITLPAATDVTEKDQVQILGRGTEPVRTFEVKTVGHQMGVLITVLAELID